MPTIDYTFDTKKLDLKDGKFAAYRHFQPTEKSDLLPLVYVPGFLRAARDFDRVAPKFAYDREVVAFDARGRGDGWRATDSHDYNMDLMIADLWELLDHLGIQRFVMVGVALGTYMGYRMAAAHPDRVAGIISNDSGTQLAGPGGKKMAANADHAHYSFDEALEKLRSANAAAFPDFGLADWDAYTRQVYAEVAPGEWVRDFDPAYFEELMRFGTKTPDVIEDFLAAKATPMLFLRGAESKFFSLETATALADQADDASVCSIQGRAHPLLLDEPGSLAAMRAFLSRLDQAAAA